jgi:hypothetical protein
VQALRQIQRRNLYGSVPSLRQLLPRLQRILEARYGQQLDEWLAGGGFTDVRWNVSPDFTVNERLMRRCLKQLIQLEVNCFDDRLSQMEATYSTGKEWNKRPLLRLQIPLRCDNTESADI